MESMAFHHERLRNQTDQSSLWQSMVVT
jgi:hypothetical protein